MDHWVVQKNQRIIGDSGLDEELNELKEEMKRLKEK